MGLEYINPATSGSRGVFPLLGTHRLRSPVSPPSSIYLIHVQRHSIPYSKVMIRACTRPMVKHAWKKNEEINDQIKYLKQNKTSKDPSICIQYLSYDTTSNR